MNTCVMCGETIPEGGKTCPACNHQVKAKLEWEQVAFYDWEATVPNGCFRVWKEGRVWKGRYWSNDKKILCFLRKQRNVRAMKDACEKYYFEVISAA